MELDELKASWHTLDQRLAENEIVNLRIVKELIAQKTKTAYDRLIGLNLYNFVVAVLITCGVFPLIFMNTPISTTSFVIVETLLVIGLVPQVRKLTVLSAFNVESKKCNELRSLVLRYKKICYGETFWTIAVVCLAMVSFYVSELGFNDEAGYVLSGSKMILVLVLTLMTFALAYIVGLWQRRRHAQQIQEIEQGLEELKEFNE